MSINPLDRGNVNYHSDDEEVQNSREGSIDGHKVSRQSSHSSSEENLDQVSSSVIGAEDGVNTDREEKTTSHHVDQGKGGVGKETKHVIGPGGDIYAVVTKETPSSNLESVVEDVKNLFDETKNSSESSEKAVQQGLKLTLASIGNDISSCLKAIPGKFQDSLEKTKEGLGKFSTNIQEGAKGIPGKIEKTFTKSGSGEVINPYPSFEGGIGDKGKPGTLDTSSVSEGPREETSTTSHPGSFDARVRSESDSEALVVGDLSPERDIYPEFSDAKRSLEKFFETTTPSMLEGGGLGYELPRVSEENRSSLEEAQTGLDLLEEKIKTQGRSARVRAAVRNFFRNLQERISAFLQFIRNIFIHSSESHDLNPVDEQSPSSEESQVNVGSEGSTTSAPGSRVVLTPEQEGFLTELRERLLQFKAYGENDNP